MDRLLDRLATARGIPTMLAVVLVALNLLLQILFGSMESFPLPILTRGNLLLHLGLIIGLLGIILTETL
jgi:hypothetical protein